MSGNSNRDRKLLLGIREDIQASLSKNGMVILPPMDVFVSSRVLNLLGINAPTAILDPWYNKGIGGERDDYVEYILAVLKAIQPLSDHVFLWGFPEIVAHFVERIPPPLQLRCWLTWFYKNSPSMIRGWRSAQMACLHLSNPNTKMHVENFLNEVQLQKLKHGKLRFIPGPPSVIEEPLLCGFVGRNEQTGHPSQKPAAVIEKLILMGTARGDLVLDLMSGAGTSAEAAYNNERFSIICDISEEYTLMAEKRLGVRRTTFPSGLMDKLHGIAEGLEPKRFRMPFKNNRLPAGIEGGRHHQLTLLMK